MNITCIANFEMDCSRPIGMLNHHEIETWRLNPPGWHILRTCPVLWGDLGFTANCVVNTYVITSVLALLGLIGIVTENTHIDLCRIISRADVSAAK